MEKFPRDRLVFKEKIGDGQFGEVHIAEADIRDLNAQFGEEYTGKTKITVAVKTLKGDVQKDAKTDFFKEVRVMSRLQHENVVRLLGVCRDDPICMIVEYMENGDLNQFLKGHVLEDDHDVMIYANTKQPISYEELIYIASQVAAGMKYFAAMNFVHRDLAARNCLVGEGLTVKLADFGMSRLLYSKHYYRVQGRVMLPIRWMAPESIFQGRFTTQTDVWSFGITLWEIFTLARDFPYPNLADEQVIGNAKTAFTKGGTGVIYNDKPDVCPQDVFDMMLSCWSSDPVERPDFNTLYDFLMSKVGSVQSVVV
ncbi:A Chain A, Epithelial discoidin domain-containing receptor 1 [Paramuricea clavata]|uniref:A Chain A, Epithelial discoidin domain-containing receptor 1 n=1 Tax=Paramuricea clavata TaxID=317549 RepID=A0A7D9IH40_PARCT|nr:A Chain A, Epithelial discoidin domain-containing receptor 1 [Paramuricea clavata]